ncbi:hypothetical protein WJX74_007759 [Apatococcus lobatus]|uniref:RNA helicase n=1 Tax=Apatococcus lobatus TaxID=904363 RepID=A0AAW1Q823_9CHLO
MPPGNADAGISFFAERPRKRVKTDAQQPAPRKTDNHPLERSSVLSTLEQPQLNTVAPQEPSVLTADTLDKATAALRELDEPALPSDGIEQPEATTPASDAGKAASEGPTATFKSLGLSEWLARTCKSLGMLQPTPVQQGCIPAILAGRDAIGTAHTGSGKTAAFALPILQKLAEDPFGVFALVLTPTRELAFQLADHFKSLGAGMHVKVAVVVGGLDMRTQSRQLAERPHIVISTPGRLLDLFESSTGLAKGFSKVRVLVMDEADRLLDAAFAGQLRQLLPVLPTNRQTLLFSATLTPSLTQLQQVALKDAHHFEAYEGFQTALKLQEEYLLIPAKVKEVYLAHLMGPLEDNKIRSAMIFVSSCNVCRRLAILLDELGITCAALHSQQSQKRRLAALARFKSGLVKVLMATDVASRGLDIPTVDLVVNYELPNQPANYVHRVGRTARAGRKGRSVSFVTQYDIELLQQVEASVGHQLEATTLPEKEVLKGITRVFAAKRAATLRLAEQDSRDEQAGKNRGPRRPQS